MIGKIFKTIVSGTKRPTTFETYMYVCNIRDMFGQMIKTGSAVAQRYSAWLETEGSRVRASPASLRWGPWARHTYPSLALVQPRKTRPYITEYCWSDVKNQIKNKQTKDDQEIVRTHNVEISVQDLMVLWCWCCNHQLYFSWVEKAYVFIYKFIYLFFIHLQVIAIGIGSGLGFRINLEAIPSDHHYSFPLSNLEELSSLQAQIENITCKWMVNPNWNRPQSSKFHFLFNWTDHEISKLHKN